VECFVSRELLPKGQEQGKTEITEKKRKKKKKENTFCNLNHSFLMFVYFLK